MLTIIPDTSEYKNIKNKFMSGIYLHGKLEQEVGYDLFGIAELEKCLPDGVYDCNFKDIPCKMWIWSLRGSENHQKGLVVYADDSESMDYAESCYNKKVSSI